MKRGLYGKDLICTEDWDWDEIMECLGLAVDMKAKGSQAWQKSLAYKNFLMLFFSPSVRTHLGFLAAATALGGHAQYMTPSMGRFQSKSQVGERIEDLAQVMSGYVEGIGIRIMENDVGFYGEGHQLIREYAKWAKVPVINLADDVCHPAQGLADIMTWSEHFSPDVMDFNALQGKTLLLTWGSGELARGWNSPQETLLLASRLGMNITVARPQGYDLDANIMTQVKSHCRNNQRVFCESDDPISGYDKADVVYSRHWLSPEAYQNGRLQKEEEIHKAKQLPEWMTTKEKMALTNEAIFTNPMPVDRGREVTDEVASGTSSVIYQVAKNRLYIQQAILALLMGDPRVVSGHHPIPVEGRKALFDCLK